MNSKKGVLLLVLMAFAVLFTGQAQEFNQIDTSSNEEFITIYLHGFWADFVQGYTVEELEAMGEDELAEKLQELIDDDKYRRAIIGDDLLGNNYFKDEWFVDSNNDAQEWDEVGILRDKKFRNISNYHLFDGYSIERAARSYTDGQTYEQVTDIFMREIGDFNTGSALLNPNTTTIPMDKTEFGGLITTRGGFTQQPFMALAKCEWVYRMTPELIKESNATRFEENLEKLLLFGPKFHETLISQDTVYNAISELGLEGNINIDTLAEEIHAIASGKGDFAGTSVPNKFRFVVHSMGGMHIMRFLTEDPSSPFGYYQRNAEYTIEDFNNDKVLYPELRASLGDDRLFEIFKKERENTIEKVVTLDSPLSGSTLPGVWKMLQESDLGDSLAGFMVGMNSAAIINIMISSIMINVATPFLAMPWTAPFAAIAIAYAKYCIIVDAVWLVLSTGILIVDSFVDFLPNSVLPKDFFPVESALFDELRDKKGDGSGDTGVLVDTYKNASPPKQKPGGEYIELNTVGFSGPPAITSTDWGVFNTNVTTTMYLEMGVGIFQIKLGRTLRVLASSIILGGLYELLDALSDNVDTPSFREVFLPLFLDLVQASHTPGSVVMAHESSSGEEIPSVWNSPKLNSFRVTATSAGVSRVRQDVEDEGGSLPERDWNFFPWSNSNRINNEYIGVHGWAGSFLTYPIGMLSEGTDGRKQVVFKHSNLNRQMETLKSVKDSSTFNIRDMAFEKAENIDDTTTNRVFYNYFMYSNDLSHETPNTIVFTEDNTYGNTMLFFDSGTEYSYRSLNTARLVFEKGSDGGILQKKLVNLDSLILTNYATALPLYISNHYQGLSLEFSINGGAFIPATEFNTNQGFNTLTELGNYNKDNETTSPILVYNDKGQAILCGPKFKEGYNGLTFRFTDQFGSTFVKNLDLMQVTVPPFVKPVFPLDNQYINTGDFTAVVQALDISDGGYKPADWFDNSEITVKVDGTVVPFTKNASDFTINAPLAGIAEGSHILEVDIIYLGIQNTKALRFWVDTTGPVLTLPEGIIFANNDMDEHQPFTFHVSDTVDFTTGALTYPVDTVFLNNLTAAITDEHGSPLDIILSKSGDKLGAYTASWNGWSMGTPVTHGIYGLQVDAADRLGNTGSGFSTFIVDNRGPDFNTPITLSTNLVTLGSVGFQAGQLLDISYNLALDSWENEAAVVVEIENTTSGEIMTLKNYSQGDTDVTFTLAYFVEGINVLKDGVYDFTVFAVDELGNKGPSSVFTNIVVDRTTPYIEKCYADPFVVKDGESQVTLRFDVDERFDITENKSSALAVKINLLDRSGAPVTGFSQINTAASPGTTFTRTITLPAVMEDGNYFFQIEVLDKHNNLKSDTAAFIKNAMAPEITLPELYSTVGDSISFYGNVGDPIWSNLPGFDHYEVYYKTGSHDIPADLSNLAGWETSAITVPAYQKDPAQAANYGRFAVTGGSLLGYLDTASIPGIDGNLVTILVVAQEVGGYRIGTTATYRVFLTGTDQTVEVAIDDYYKNGAKTHYFTLGDDLSITYGVNHGVDNPVDIFFHVKDDSGKIVFRKSYYNLNSSDIKGTPQITGETGVFIYQDDTNRFWVDMRNNGSEMEQMVLSITSSHVMTGFVDESGTPIAAPVTLVNEGKMLAEVKQLSPGESYRFGFNVADTAQLDINALYGIDAASIYIGKNKQLNDTGLVSVYPGSSYPPLVWNGKDAFGRYMPNGVYTLGIEAFGNLGGHGSDSINYTIDTPYSITVKSVTNREIQPGVSGFDSSTVTVNLNKPTSLITAEVLNSSGGLVSRLSPSETSLDNAGNIFFSWSGLNSNNQPAGLGSYSYRIVCTPADGGIPFIADKTTYPELDGITVVLPSNMDTSLTTDLYAIAGQTTFDGTPVTEGNDDYRVNISAKGQYLPTKQVTVTAEGTGTQVVTAHPEMNYMGALRAVYTEVIGEIDIESITVYDDDVWKDDYRTGYPDETVTWTAAKFDPATGTFAKQDLDVTIDVTIRVDKPGDWGGLEMKYSSASLKIIKGKEYLSNDHISVTGSYQSRSDVGDDDMNVVVRLHIKYSASNVNLSSTRYHQVCDSFGTFGPDVVDDTPVYAHKTAYVNKDRSISLDIVENGTTDVGMPSVSSQENFYRGGLQYWFYYVGEDYPEPGAGSDPTSNIDFTHRVYSENQMLATVKKQNVTATLFGNKSWDLEDGNIRFNVDCDYKLFGSNDYTITVESTAYDRILYPYPAARTEWENGTTIGSQEFGIPTVHINKTRPDNFTSTPYFHVPEFIEGNRNISFSGAANVTVSANTNITFSPDTGYTGEIGIGAFNSQVPPGVNVKNWRITGISSPGVTFTGINGTSLDSSDVNARVVIADTNIVKIDDAKWDLYDDTLTGSSMWGPYTDINLDELNRYGILKETRISSIYPYDSAENWTPKNMFFTGLAGMRFDNPNVVIDPSIRDYSDSSYESGYDIEIRGYDGAVYQGLRLKGTPAYMGRGLKQSDGFILEKTAERPKRLVRLRGRGTGDIELSFIGAGVSGWTEIPIYGSSSFFNTLTYWDVTGLNGLYTVRLVSKVDNRINTSYQDVYIGRLLNTTNGDASLSTPGGQAKIIFPQGSLTEDTIVNIDTVEMSEVADVAIMPDIAPIGKVITLSKTGDNHFDVLPQLQFTYNKSEIDELGINPAELVIYHLREDGVLAPLNTVKQLVKVHYDGDGVFLGESVLWGSDVDSTSNIPADYTYLKAWSTLAHFSYYVLLEGALIGVPEINLTETETANLTIDVPGTGIPNEKVRMYVRNTPLSYPGQTEPDMVTWTNGSGDFVFTGVNLPYEGDNYLYVGYAGSKNSEFIKVNVVRDTAEPSVNVGGYFNFISPDGNGNHDTISISLTADEDSTLDIKIADKDTGAIMNYGSMILPKDTTAVYTVTGTDYYGSVLPEGQYDILFTVSDALGNSGTFGHFFTLDLTPPVPGTAYVTPVISPANHDLFLDRASGSLVFDSYTYAEAWIGTADEPKFIKVGYTMDIPEPGISFPWDGRNRYGDLVEDGEYFITIEGRDLAGNTMSTVLDETIRVDNTAPRVDSSVLGGTLFVVPFDKEWGFSVSEDAHITVEVIDTYGDVQFTSGNNYTKGSNSFTWSADDTLADGHYGVKFTATDLYGNISVKVVVVQVTHDITPPDITVIGVADGNDYTESVVPVITITDSQSGVASSSITLNGVPFVSGTEVTETGFHVLEISAVDGVGNTAYLKISFMIFALTEIAISADTAEYSDETTIYATLTSRGSTVPGKTIEFYYGNSYIGSGVTDSQGTARINHTIFDPAGNYPVSAEFKQADYLRPSDNTTDVTVIPEKATISYTGEELFNTAEDVVLTAAVSQEDDGFPGDYSECTVIFTITEDDGHGNTTLVGVYEADCDANGSAVLVQTIEPGLYDVEVAIKDEGYYTPDSDTNFFAVYDPAGGFVTGGGWLEFLALNTETGTEDNALLSYQSQMTSDGAINGVFNFYFRNWIETVVNGQTVNQARDDNFILDAFNWFVKKNGAVHTQGKAPLLGQEGEYTFRISCTDNPDFYGADIITIRIWRGTDTSATPIYITVGEALTGTITVQ